jgi:uncharacterized ferritin-like protein (DUF455 family)
MSDILVAASKAKSMSQRVATLDGVRPRDFVPITPAIAEPSTGETMGQSADKMAKINGIPREAQDRLALRSHQHAARGLDVTPATLERVTAAGDAGGAKILARILDDEIRHVAVGTKHFLRCAGMAQEAPESLWQNLVKRHFRGVIKPPFNDSARLAAGLSREFYAAIAH